MRHNIFDSIPSNIVSDKANVFADFLQTAGLYDSMKISEDNIQDLNKALSTISSSIYTGPIEEIL